MIRRLLIALLAFSFTSFVYANDNVGTSGAEFLKIGPGARPVGMGEAFTGVADDIHAVYWNPAGLANLKVAEMAGMHMQYFQNIQYEFASFVYPTQRYGSFGWTVTNLHTDDIQRRTEDTDTSLGSFGSSDNAYWLSYGKSITSRLSLGANLKYIHQTLDSIDSNAYAADGGILYNTDWHELRLGASIQNLGSKVKFVNESDPLPRTYRLGASAPLLSHRLLVASDLIIPRDHQVGLALGGEYRHSLSRDIVAVARGGYRTDSDVDGLSGVSAGGGIEVGRATFDFAWVPFGDLGNSYRFGLHIKFSQPDNSTLRGPKPAKTSESIESDHDTALEQLLSL
jgi:hypothetical protein